jgi:hypothetical protein
LLERDSSKIKNSIAIYTLGSSLPPDIKINPRAITPIPISRIYNLFFQKKILLWALFFHLCYYFLKF